MVATGLLRRRRTDRSIVFARWRQYDPHLIHGSLGPRACALQNPFHLRFSRFASVPRV